MPPCSTWVCLPHAYGSEAEVGGRVAMLSSFSLVDPPMALQYQIVIGAIEGERRQCWGAQRSFRRSRRRQIMWLIGDPFSG